MHCNDILTCHSLCWQSIGWSLSDSLNALPNSHIEGNVTVSRDTEILRNRNGNSAVVWKELC